MTNKRALITGITGQDGAYLSKLLLEKGYSVFGVVRRSSHAGVDDHRLRWIGVSESVDLRDGDLADMSSLIRIVQDVKPDELYNLAAQSFVYSSWQQPILTANVTAVGVTNVLEGVAGHKTRYAVLSGVVFRNVWKSAAAGAVRDNAMRSPSCTAIGSRSIIVRALAFMPPRAYFSTMRAHCAALNSSLEKSRMASRASNTASRRNYGLAILMRNATGATRKTMFAQCGPCCSNPTRTTTWSQAAAQHLSAKCVAPRLHMLASPWRTILSSIPPIFGLQKSTCFWGTLRKLEPA
jgi:GDP-mannose 4,6 dehydratase